MTHDEEVKLKLNDHDHEIKSLKHRVSDIESKQSEIGKLAQSVNELAINMRYMVEEQKKQGERLRKLETEPLDNAKHFWRTFITAIITTLVGGGIGALIAHFVGG